MKFDDYKQYLSPALAKSTDLIIEKGKGCYVTDVNGDEYLDFVQGIAVNAFGHCHPKIIEAMKNQIDKLVDASFNLVNYPSTLKFAEKLAQHTPGDLNVIFFSNGGSEAIDGAIKLARNYTGRPGIIAMRGSFHGRSLGATSVTGSNSKYRKNIEPLLPSVYFTPYPNCFRCPYNTTCEKCSLECLRELQWLFDYLIYPGNVAAVIMEPLMGEGGYVVPPQKYLDEISKLLKKHGILLIFDEIQSGYGRTGKMFAGENFGIVPDIITMGKAIAGGLPMSAIASTKEIMDKWLPGQHGTTFGGHPVCAAAGLAVLELMEEENILENVNKQGAYLKERLSKIKEKYPIIGDVRGLGLMVAAEFVNPEDNSPSAAALDAVKDYCFKKKMLTLSCGVYGNGFRFATPLNVTREDLDKGLAIFEEAVAAASAK
ncbi:MAG TPA: aspartate aminotransferase family protein [Anaerovoracaceae bacterium]|nr:aspartate aminotransferase family protein [Anaerovoracaceae bacterium]